MIYCLHNWCGTNAEVATQDDCGAIAMESKACTVLERNDIKYKMEEKIRFYENGF